MCLARYNAASAMATSSLALLSGLQDQIKSRLISSSPQLLIEAAEYDDGFTKIVHAVQPKSRNLLAETHEEGKPVKDAGIRLGWDDEQILIWYLRQLGLDADGKRVDAPLGVFGYAIDVRETSEPAKYFMRPSR